VDKWLAQIAVILSALGGVSGILLWRRQGRNVDADTQLKEASALATLTKPVLDLVHQHAKDAEAARADASAARVIAERAVNQATACRDELAAVRLYLADVQAWATRNARPDAEPMPSFRWRLPDPQIRSTD
jgi:hypothetical protein